MIFDNNKIKLCDFSSSKNYINAHARCTHHDTFVDDLEGKGDPRNFSGGILPLVVVGGGGSKFLPFYLEG